MLLTVVYREACLQRLSWSSRVIENINTISSLMNHLSRTGVNFNKQVKSLVDAGISRASLQNLHTDKRGKVIPFVQLVEINFDQQLPPNYVTPTSKYSHLSFVA